VLNDEMRNTSRWRKRKRRKARWRNQRAGVLLPEP